MRRVLAAGVLACSLRAAEVGLIIAAADDDLTKVETLLAGHADPKAATPYGITALLEAAGHGNAAMVEKLLQAGADANTATPEGETPLMAAARSGSAASVNSCWRLERRSMRGKCGKARRRSCGRPPQTARGLPAVLLAAGADVNTISTAWPVKPKKKEDGNLVSSPPRGGLIPLLFAARQGSLETARVMVDGKADLNLAEPDGISPTVMAIINGHYDLAGFLLEAGADPNAADHWGRTALYAAIDMQTLEPSVTRPAPKSSDRLSGFDVAKIALAHGAKADAALTEPIPGRGVSDYADPILTTGSTAFIRAAKTGDIASMRLLLQNGANPKAVTRHGVNALMAAAGLGWRYGDSVVPEADGLAAVKLCLELGLDPNTANDKGRTALHGAAERGGTGIVEWLVSKGADMNAKDKEEQTPLDVAKGNGGRDAPEYPQTVALFQKLAAR